MARTSTAPVASLSAAPKRLLENYTPPEGVPIGLEVASIGARVGALMLDLTITWTTIIALILFLLWLGVLPESAFLTLVVILAFFAGIPYYVLSELIWNGRTLGKRMVGIRVVSADGRSLHPHQVVARNLLKEAEVFAPFSLLQRLNDHSWPMVVIVVIWVLIVIVIPLRNRRKQRLGDIVAGTIVVVRPKAVLLDDLVLRAAPTARFTFDQAQLDIYGRYELQTLEAILRDQSTSPLQKVEVQKVARTIARRINYVDPAVEADPRGFLMAFYREQRERLESRQLFGERRDDKFHADRK